MGNMRFKVGDRVRIKSLDWYNDNKDIHGNIECGDALMNIEKSQFCSKIVTISSISNIIDTYQIEEDNGKYIWTDDMIEGLVEKKISIKLTGEAIKNNERVVSVDEYILPEGYIFKDENGNVINARKIVLEKKKKGYPKTYEECSVLLGCEDKIPLKIIGEFTRLINARNAYWKLYGEEMGLGRPWEPIYQDDRQDKHCIYVNIWGITLHQDNIVQHVLTFPTEEMRDAFYENFKKEIEQCKELL